MSKRRSYQQYCGIAKALDVVGERWTLLIARELLLGPRRYSDLLANLKGLTTNLLAQRLKELTAAGIVERQELPPPGRVAAYALTPAGRELEPVLLALGRWGWRYMAEPRRGDRLYIGWALIALKRRYRGVERPLTVELNAGASNDSGGRFQVRLSPDYADAREGAPWVPDVTVSGTPDTFRAMFLRGASSAGLEAKGALNVTGTPDAWGRFLQAFDLAA